MKESVYEESKIDPTTAQTDFEKAFVNGWNSLMDSIQQDGCRIGIVTFDDEDLKKTLARDSGLDNL